MPEPGSARGRPALISVILPIRNGEAHLEDQVASLAAQTYSGPWELVAVDNGCTDRSMEIVERWRGRLARLVVVDARGRRGLNHARNAGAAAARGDLLAFCDADDVTAPNWLEGLAAAAAEADIVGGAMERQELNSPLGRAWQSADLVASLQSCYAFLPHPPGGNCAIWADVAREVRWDEAFAFGSSDIDFTWRAQLAGYRVAFAPQALIRRRFRTSLRALIKQWFRYGLSEPHLFRRHRRHGMRRDGKGIQNWRWLATSAPLLLTAPGRGRWCRIAAWCCGRACGSLRWRVLYP